MPPRPAERPVVWAAIALIAGGVLAAYANCYRGVLVLDDTGNLLENASIRHLGTAWFPPAGGLSVSGRPLVNVSFALNYLAGGTHWWGYHALSLSIHLAAALALFGIIRRISSTGFGFAVALIWSVHPLLTSAVTYLSQRAESLMGLWYLLTLYTFIRAMQAAPGVSDRGLLRQPWAWASVLSCACGMATKEVMVTAPLMVFAFDSILFAASPREAFSRRRSYYGALAATWLIAAWLTTHTGSRADTVGFGSGLQWWAYAIAQLGAVCRYLRLAIWPAPLVADYGRLIDITPLQAIGCLAILLGLGAATVVLLWRRSRWGLCGAWFFLILGPSSSVIPIATEIMAEHRMYLPLIGVVVLVVAGAIWVGRAVVASVNALGLAALLLTSSALGAATYRRNEVYLSLETYWRDVARKVPSNAGAHNNLGNVAKDRGDWAAAAAEYRAALAIEPQFSGPHGNLGLILVGSDRPAEAIGHLEAALHFQPENPTWKRGLADARAKIGNGLAEAGRAPEAIAQYQAALALAPDLADVRNNLGGLLAESGHLREAEAQFAEAVRLQPGYREAQNNLRKVRAMEGLSPGP